MRELKKTTGYWSYPRNLTNENGSPHSSSVTSTSDTFETYEEMELACLKKLIVITKN
jgi:hypothetical protein